MPERIACTVVLPTTRSGRPMATRGSWAEARCSASNDRLTPRCDRATEIVAFVIDHVEGGRRAEVDDDLRAAVFLESGDGVDEAVGPHLLRSVDENPNADVDVRRADDHGGTIGIPAEHPPQAEQGCRHDSGDDAVGDVAAPDVLQSESWASQTPISSAVRLALVDDRHSPIMRPSVVEDGENRVGIAGIDREQHRAALRLFVGREDVAREDQHVVSHALLQHQCSRRIEIGEDAGDGVSVQLHFDRAMQTVGAGAPGLSHRWKPCSRHSRGQARNEGQNLSSIDCAVSVLAPSADSEVAGYWTCWTGG